GFIAMSLYAWINLSGPMILINEIIGKTLSTGITFGVFAGFVVVLAGELPARLVGFWPLWMRLLAGLIFGTLAGTLVWAVYHWLLLFTARPVMDVMALVLGGLGIALGFTLAGAFRLGGWLAGLLTGTILFLFIWLSYDLVQRPFLYFSGPEAVIIQSLMVAFFIALGGYAPALVRGIRRLAQRRQPAS